MMLRVLMTGLLLFACAAATAAQPALGAAGMVGQGNGTVEFAGFSVPELGEGSELATVEHSNGTVYGLDVYRVSPGDVGRFSERTPLVRFSQTVRALSEVGTIEQLQETVLEDARKLYEGPDPHESEGESRTCTRVVLGRERAGRGFDAALGGGAGTSGQPVRGRVETYAFEHEGKGVAVMLKVASDGVGVGDDAGRLRTIVGETRMKAIGPLTPYTFPMGGYPVRLPAGSRVVSVDRPNEHTLTGEVVLDDATLSVFIMRVPQQYSPRDVFAQVERTYEQRLAASIKQSGGRARLEWTSSSPIPAGPESRDAIDAAVYMLGTPDGKMYSALYKNLDGRIVVSGVFSARPVNADKLHRYARIFVDGFRGDTYAEGLADKTMHFDGWRLTLPRRYSAGVIRDTSGTIGSLAVVVGGAYSGEGIFRSATGRESFTLLRSLGHEEDLRGAHRGLGRSLGALGAGPDSEASDPIAIERTLAAGREIGWLVSALSLTPEAGAGGTSPAAEPVTLRISSAVVAVDGRELLVSAVSPAVMAEDALSMAEQAIGKIGVSGDRGRVELGFGVLEIDPRRVYVERERVEERGLERTAFEIGPDRVQVFTLDPDSRLRVMSERLLAARHMTRQWKRVAFGDEQDLFPANGDGLGEATIAGHSGRAFVVHLPGKDEDESRRRGQSTRIGLYGFLHGEQYSVIVITQSDDFSDERFGEILGMFTAKGRSEDG